MKETILEIAVMGFPAILLGLSWWRWAVLPPPYRAPTWRFRGMLVAMAAGSASILAWYSVLAFAYTLDKKNHSEYVGRTYWTGVLLCLVGTVAALVGKRAPRILTVIAMLLLLDWAVTLGPLITPP